MAERRMFAKTIIDSDAFLDMPLSTQALYFHLSMRADDEGFINNPKKIQRMIGASDDDAKILHMKKLIIAFENGVIVIKHWKIHNYIRADRLKETVHTEERDQLSVKENGAYTQGNFPVSHVSDTCQSDDSIGKDRLGKDRLGKDNNSALCANSPFEQQLIDYRKRIKKPLKTDVGLKALVKALEETAKENGISIQEAFEYMEKNEWQSIKPHYIKNSQPHKGKQSQIESSNDHAGNSWLEKKMADINSGQPIHSNVAITIEGDE